MTELTAALDGLAGAVRNAIPDRTVDTTWRWQVPRAAETGLRACPGLAEALRPIPATHRHGKYIRCVCGVGVRRQERWTFCPGGCGRVFIADVSGAWAALLPEQTDA